MASPAGHFCGPHSAGTTANDEHFLLHRRFYKSSFTPQFFLTDGRVLDAAEKFVDPHTADAPLVVCDAVADVVRASFKGFFRHKRIADQRTAHPYHVGLTGSQHFFGHNRIVYAPGAEDRQLELLTHPGSERNGVAERSMH